MTERGPQGAEGLTPAQSEAVRRLLAGARHDEGIPDDVATRLDAAIAELAAERTDGAPAEEGAARAAVVIPLHRRRWPQVLVAAAAVTVFGFSMTQIVGNGADDADSGASPAAEEPEVANAPETTNDRGVDSTSPDFVPPQDLEGGSRDNSLLKLDRASLHMLGIKELRQLRRGTLATDLSGLIPSAAAENADSPSAYAARAAAVSCGPYYRVSGGEILAASYRRHFALVLFHPELDGVRLVEIYDCESDNPRQTVRTVTLQTGE